MTDKNSHCADLPSVGTTKIPVPITFLVQEQVLENPRASRASMAVTADDLEPCIGCMAVTANVLLQRRCGGAENRYITTWRSRIKSGSKDTNCF
jgi:Putative transmembrane protein precursor